MDSTRIPAHPLVMVDTPECLTGDTWSLDFESYYDKEVTLRRMDHRTYVSHPRADIYLMSVYDGTHAWVGHPSSFDWNLTKDKTLVSFNAVFDMACYLFGLNEPQARPYKEWLCAKAAANYLGLYGTLADLTKQLFGVSVDKSVREKAKGVDFSKLDAIPQDMLEYCALDSYYCHAIWNKLNKYWPGDERACWYNTVTMGYRGLPTAQSHLDDGQALLTRALGKYADVIPMEKKLSLPQLKQACIEAGVPAPETTAKNSPKYVDWLEEWGQYVPWVADIAKYRSVNRLIAGLTNVKARVYADSITDWIPYTLTYCGASTGRWTAGGDGFNAQNMNRSSVEGFDLRSILRAPKGYKLVVSDFAGIEARLIAYVCGQNKLLDLLRKGEKDIYLAAAISWGLVPAGTTDFKKYCKETPGKEDLRQSVKASVLASGFKGGWSAVQRSNPGMPKEKCQALVDMYRRNSPEVCAWWDSLDKQAEAGMRTPTRSFALTLPSGRKLYYRNMYRKLIQPKDGRKAYGAVCTDFGSKSSIVNTNLIANNYIQGFARDLMANVFNRVCTLSNCIPILLVHDEICVLAKEDEAEQVAQQIKGIMETPPTWAEGLPLLVEPELMTYYRK